MDKTVTNYFRKNHNTISGASQLQTIKFKAKLLEAKNKNRAPKAGGAETPAGGDDSSLRTESNLEYNSEDELEELSAQMMSGAERAARQR